MIPSYSTLLLSSLLAVVSAKPSVIFPLYIYPSDGAWLPLTNVIAANPGVHFKIVINPNSGPFPLGTSAINMTDYISNLPNITKYANAKTYGYVDTNFPKYGDDDIVHNIDAWKYGPAQLVPTGGIFFDDVVSNNASAIWQMNNVQSYARADNFTDIIFNCGQAPAYPDPRSSTPTVSGLYSMADEILVYENYVTAPTGADPAIAPAAPTNVPSYINLNNQNEPYTKLSAMIYDFSPVAKDNSVTGGCATSKSALCTFVNSFTGVVESLYVSNIPTAKFTDPDTGAISYGGDYTAVPPNFANFVSILAAS